MPYTTEEIRAHVQDTIEQYWGPSRIHIDTMGGHCSSRIYHRISSGSRTLIVMELGENARRCEEFCDGDPPGTELPFVEISRYLAAGHLPVPKIIAYLEEKQLLILEDLGSTTLEDQLRICTVADQTALYKAALDLLLRIQRYTQQTTSGSASYGWRISEQVLLRELEHFSEWYLAAHCNAQLSVPDKKVISTAYANIARELAAQSTIWIHRDFQSRNLMVAPDPSGNVRLTLIDYQDGIVGPPFYDLVSLLRDSYVSLSPQQLDDLLHYYHARMEFPLGVAEFRRQFWLQTLQRKMKDAGRFIFIAKAKGNPNFMQFLPTTLPYLVDALSSLPELASLRSVLHRYLVA